jgi:4,5-dihydroxyphthalate decarboxylase
MPSPQRITLNTAIGAKAWRKSLDSAQADATQFALAFADVSPIHRAFAPMAREQTFDVSEMAIVTALQALAYGKPLVLLPVTVAARFQHACLITRRTEALTPSELCGRRVGVRAFTQTTGVWLRGILENDYGIPAGTIRWVTQEGAHVSEYRDPPWVEKAPEGRSLVDMLRSGVIDAAIFGNDLPDDPAFVPVIREPQAAASAWYEKYNVVPVNHMLVVRKDIAAAHPEAIREFWQVIERARPRAAEGPDMAPIGIAANVPALQMILQYCEQQLLLPRKLGVEEIVADAAALLGDQSGASQKTGTEQTRRFN